MEYKKKNVALELETYNQLNEISKDNQTAGKAIYKNKDIVAQLISDEHKRKGLNDGAN